jgi:hypothetical protein
VRRVRPGSACRRARLARISDDRRRRARRGRRLLPEMRPPRVRRFPRLELCLTSGVSGSARSILRTQRALQGCLALAPAAVRRRDAHKSALSNSGRYPRLSAAICGGLQVATPTFQPRGLGVAGRPLRELCDRGGDVARARFLGVRACPRAMGQRAGMSPSARPSPPPR